MKNHLLIFCGILLLAGCQKEFSDTSPPPEKAPPQMTTRSIPGDGMIVLGEKLPNPYSLSNMKTAIKILNINKTNLSNEPYFIKPESLIPSHYYIRFHPRTHEDLDLLKQDTTLILYDYPIDYEIEQDGGYYHDPSIPDSLPTYQYASVGFMHYQNNTWGDVEYKILEELFIPDEYKDDTSAGRAVAVNSDIDKLVNLSFQLCGDPQLLEDGIDGPSPGESIVDSDGKWRPQGKITYLDEVANQTIGLQGIRIRARRWFTTHTGVTQADGSYRCDGRFKRPANYKFSFERADFGVTSPNQLNIWINGPKVIDRWDYHFSRSTNPLEYFYATVFRAAFHYCYKDIEHLNRPPRSEGLRSKIWLRCYNETNDDIRGRFIRGTFIFSSKHIRIYNPHYNCDNIYATAIHELAHSAHWRQDRSFYEDKIKDIVQESWATGVEIYLTRQIYPGYSQGYRRGDYTGIVRDLMDGVGLLKKSSYYKEEGKKDQEKIDKTYIDNVSGYTIKQIEDALTGVETFEDWKNNLKSKYPDNETKENLDAAFTYWISR